MDRGAWQAIVHEVSESDMTEWLTLLHFITIPKKWEREIEVLFFIEECQLIHMEKMILLEDNHFGTTMEKRMATHSSILAWRIPWTEEPGGLWSIESPRVRHDWSDLTCTHRQWIYPSLFWISAESWISAFVLWVWLFSHSFAVCALSVSSSLEIHGLGWLDCTPYRPKAQVSAADNFNFLSPGL